MKRRFLLLFLFLMVGFVALEFRPLEAAWVWSPETGKWTNPKNEPKDTPEEQFHWARSFYDQKDYKRALDEFGKLTKAYPNTQWAAEGQFHQALCYEALGDILKASEGFSLLIDRYPYSKRVSEAVEHEFELAEAMLEGKKTKFLGMPILPAKDTAAGLYKHIVKSAPYGPYGANAQYRLGEAYLAMGDLEEAERAFERLIEEYPSSEYAAKARYQIARVSYRAYEEQEYHMPKMEEAIQKYEGFKASKPSAGMEFEANEAINQLRQKKAQSLYETAVYYKNRRKVTSARIYLSDILREFPDTAVAQNAKALLTEIDSMEKNEKPSKKSKPWWRII